MKTIDQTRDPLDLLTAARPGTDALEATWTPARAGAALAATLRSPDQALAGRAPSLAPRRPGLPRRRWVALGAAASVLAGTGLAATTALAPTAVLTPASALERTVQVAAQAPVGVPDRGYWHSVMTTTSTGAGAPEVASIETWSAADGTEVGLTRTDGHALPFRAGDGVPGSMGSIAFIRGLPADPTALVHALDHAVGEDQHTDLSRFDALTSLLYKGTARPAVRAAAIRALTTLHGIRVRTDTLQGRQLLRIDLHGAQKASGSEAPADATYSYTSTTWLDPRTSLVVESQVRTDAGRTFRTVLSDQEVRRSLPDGLLDRATGR